MLNFSSEDKYKESYPTWYELIVAMGKVDDWYI